MSGGVPERSFAAPVQEASLRPSARSLPLSFGDAGLVKNSPCPRPRSYVHPHRNCPVWQSARLVGCRATGD
ncbi:hypothetical protein [Azospirillum palustre]